MPHRWPGGERSWRLPPDGNGAWSSLDEFLRSPVADEGLKAILKKIPSYGKKRRR